MVDVTLLELHLEDASFRANAPFSGSDEETESETEARERGGGGPSKLLLAVVLFGVVGAVVWWSRNKQTPELGDELEVPA